MGSTDSLDWTNPSVYSNSDNLTNLTNLTNGTPIQESTDSEVVAVLRLIFEAYGVTLVALLGIILNMLSIVVFLQRRMRSTSMNILLLGLQIFDLLVVTTCLYIAGLRLVLKHWGIVFSSSNHIMFFYVVALSMVGKTGSHYFTILVSLERYTAVCHPLQVQVLCSRRRAMMASIVVTIFVVFSTLPHWLKVYWETWYFVELVIIQLCLPFVVLVCLNLAIYIGYRKSQKVTMELRSTKANDGDKSLTLLLFSIVLVYLFCNSFFLMEYFANQLGLHDSWFITVFIRPLTDFLIIFNSACNFVFYCAYGQKFRTELKRLFGVKEEVPKSAQRRTFIAISGKSSGTGDV